MGGMINPVIQRAPGVVPRFVTSETEKVLGLKRNHFRELRDPYSPNCYCIRYECQRCGMYVHFVKERPAEIPQSCHYCNSKQVGIDGCDGWTNLTLPNLSKPMKLNQPLVPASEKVTLKCSECGQEFRVQKSRNHQRTCSPRCGAQRQKYLRVMRQEGK
jgi:ribosomal protein L33